MPDQSLLLYTRRYLARDHLLNSQPNELCRLSPICPITDIRDPFTFSPSDDLDHFPSAYINYSEKLVLEYETAIYLSSILTSPDEGVDLLLEDPRWSKKFRMEEPLVVEQRRRNLHKISDDSFEVLPIGTIGDLGIPWGRDVRRQVREYLGDIEAEKMILGPEVLEFLQGIHRPETPPSTTDVIEKEVGCFKPIDLRYMTPPLLPPSPVALSSLPKLTETFNFQLVDAGETRSLIADLAASFMAADSILDGPFSESPSSFLQMNPPTPSPIRKRSRPEILMVEALLTPPASTIKKVRFTDLELPPRISTPENEIEDQLDGKQILLKMSHELAQEQLQEADSTLRVETPFVDLSMPKLPWEGLVNSLEKLRDLESWAGVAARYWSGGGGVGMGLLWRPFLKGAIKIPIESLGDEEIIKDIAVIPGEFDNSERSLMDGLRTLGLEAHEEEIELEPGIFTVKTDIEGLLKRRKRKGPKAENLISTTVTEDESKVRNNPRVGAALSGNPLENFMALRSRVTKKPRMDPAPIPRVIQIGIELEKVSEPIATVDLSAISEIPTFPTPKIQLPASPGTFIASTTLLAERRLFRLIKDLYSTANIIERDFSVPIIDHFADITSNQNDSAEADLILSSFSGIIITSLQKIRQAPMPGQALSTIRQRVMSLSLLYERLFVMVLGTVHEGDSETVAAFIGFTVGLRTGIHVQVLKKEDEVVARWIVALMVREGGDVRLLDEETLWERFLRKAGFNAFAAQVVLRSCRDGGLRKFLKMSANEKKRAFGGVVGERVIERVLARLEGRWEI